MNILLFLVAYLVGGAIGYYLTGKYLNRKINRNSLGGGSKMKEIAIISRTKRVFLWEFVEPTTKVLRHLNISYNVHRDYLEVFLPEGVTRFRCMPIPKAINRHVWEGTLWNGYQALHFLEKDEESYISTRMWR